MGFYEEQILPCGINWVMGMKPFNRLRERYVKDASGDVLEVGFGSGLNLPFYSPQVKKLYALDPSKVGRKLAGRRIRRAPFPVECLDLNADQSIPLADASVDAVVTTWTLCTIPEVAAALKEFARVLKPDGLYFFLEHGKAPNPSVAHWQDVWNPAQKFLAGGCHVNRAIDRLILDAGFRMVRLDTFYMPGLKVLSYMYGGCAAVDK